MQMGMDRLRGGQNHDLRKSQELIEASDKLISILKKELNQN
jgi:hypothetical protein